jgi:hypothetical protein
MLPTMFGCAQQGSAAPLALSITTPDNVEIAVPMGQTGATSNAGPPGDIRSVATATGGDGSYSYAWTLIEVSDATNEYSIASQGTTTNATYEDATVSTSFSNVMLPPPNPPPVPPPPADYRVSCTVTDGNGDSVTKTADFQVAATG